jgi:tetratricopeptide (TPR) repeat protein
VANSQGNTLLLIELARHAQRGQRPDSLPTSLEELALQQLNMLDDNERDLVQRLSVLGLSFNRNDVETVVHADPLANQLLESMLDQGTILQATHDGRIRFLRSTMREISYERLPYRKRRELHGAIADQLSGRAAHEDLSDALSWHNLNAGRSATAWSASLEAIERAERRYAFADVARLSRRALDIARNVDVAQPAELLDLNERLGDALRRGGDNLGANRAYQLAHGLEETDPRHRIELAVKIASVHLERGQPAQARRWITRSLKTLDDVDVLGSPTPDWVRTERANLNSLYAGCLLEQGRALEAIDRARAAMADSLAAQDKRTLAESYSVLAAAHSIAGVPAELDFGRLALVHFQELGDHSAVARALNNMAVNAWNEGRGAEAMTTFEVARDAFATTGDLPRVAVAEYNRADVLLRQGRLAEANESLHDLIAQFRVFRNPSYLASAQRGAGLAALRLGDLPQARNLITNALASFASLGIAAEAIETQVAMSELLIVDGRPGEAIELIDETLKRSESLGTVYLSPALYRQRGLAHEALGDLALAAGDLTKARILAKNHARSELGDILTDLARISRKLGEADIAAVYTKQAKQALRRLGAVQRPLAAADDEARILNEEDRDPQLSGP